MQRSLMSSYIWPSFIHNLHKSRSVSRRGIDCLFLRKHNSDLTRFPYFRIAGNRAKSLQCLSSPVWMKHELVYLNIITARNICFSHTYLVRIPATVYLNFRRPVAHVLVMHTYDCRFFTLQYRRIMRPRARVVRDRREKRRKKKEETPWFDAQPTKM